MDEGESHILLAQYMAGMIAQSIKKIKGENKILNQIHICNSIFKKSFDSQSLNSELGQMQFLHDVPLLTTATKRFAASFQGKKLAEA